MMKQYTFKKQERLSRRKTIQSLFSEGQAFVKYPFRVSFIHLDEENQPLAQILVSVTKKRFKRANKRNLLKRRIREAYRLNKFILPCYSGKSDKALAIAFIYLPTEVLEFADIEKGMKKALARIAELVAADEKSE